MKPQSHTDKTKLTEDKFLQIFFYLKHIMCPSVLFTFVFKKLQTTTGDRNESFVNTDRSAMLVLYPPTITAPDRKKN